jgi:hypothetical protein
VKLLGLVMPVASFLAIILTANHFFLDGIVGGMLALFGLAAAIAISLRNSGWRSTQPPPHTTLE